MTFADLIPRSNPAGTAIAAAVTVRASTLVNYTAAIAAAHLAAIDDAQVAHAPGERAED